MVDKNSHARGHDNTASGWWRLGMGYRPEYDVELLSCSSVVVTTSEPSFQPTKSCKNLCAELCRHAARTRCKRIKCMTKELTVSAPSTMEIMVGARRRKLLHCWRQILPSRGSSSRSPSRIHDRVLPDGEIPFDAFAVYAATVCWLHGYGRTCLSAPLVVFCFVRRQFKTS